MSLTVKVKEFARSCGADLVGVAPIDRFRDAPLRMSPQGLLPGATCVVVAAIHHLDAAVELGGEPTPHDCGPYSSQSWGQNDLLDDLSFRLARRIEAEGFRALAIAASNIWRYRGYKDLAVAFAPDLAHRYAAVAAGLGEIGWNNLVLTPEFGPRARFVSVVTDAPLEASPMYAGPALCDRCLACVKHCPTDAFRQEVRGTVTIDIGGRSFEFPQTNKWRCAWAENFCLDLAHAIPDHVDESVIRRYIEQYGMRGGEEGSCLKFCMNPQLRYYDRDYCRAPRRRKSPSQSPEALLDAALGVFRGGPADVMAIGRAEDFGDDFAFHPRYHLPDAATVISLGVDPPAAGVAQETAERLARQLRYAAFRLAHLFDVAGYSAVAHTFPYHHLVAQRLGTLADGRLYMTVLTSAALAPGVHRASAPAEPVTAAGIRQVARQSGPTWSGSSGVRRFEAFRSAVEAAGLIPAAREVVHDRGLAYTPFVPETAREPLRLKGPADWLPGAKSVIVLGLHLPNANVDTAKTTPAETVGPFAFAMYETLRLLGDAACRLVKHLERAGRRAVITSDLTGLASWTSSPRGRLVDMRANAYAALLAGLAWVGRSGCPLTPQFGVRQRFIAIVTDLDLPDDDLLDPAGPCEKCDGACLRACPTRAIRGETVPVEFAGRRYELAGFHHLACDWAKLYCLAGEEGPKYLGLSVDVPVPDRPDAAAIAHAAAGADWGVQKRLLSVAEECVRVCPAHAIR